MRKWMDKYGLFAAVIIGAVGFPFFRHLAPALPPLIFLMLFFTFCKVNPLDLRWHRWHTFALIVQLSLAMTSYLLVRAIGQVWPVFQDPSVAQSWMLCFLMPSATAAPIIAGKLGGSIQNLTTYTLITNLSTAILVPLLFPWINPALDMPFWLSVWAILRRVGIVLLGPFVTAWLLRLIYDAIQRHKGSDKTFQLSRSWAQVPFYAWVCTILILMGNITNTLIYDTYSPLSAVLICIGALISCFIQFTVGKWLGYRFPATSHGMDYKDVVINPATAPTTPAGISRVTAGQALGQKNTTLAIWLAQAYLNPLTALGPAAYMIIQNLFNAAQLSKAAKKT